MVDASSEPYDVILQEFPVHIEVSGAVKPYVDDEVLTARILEILKVDDLLPNVIFSTYAVPANSLSEFGFFTPGGSRINSHIIPYVEGVL